MGHFFSFLGCLREIESGFQTVWTCMPGMHCCATVSNSNSQVLICGRLTRFDFKEPRPAYLCVFFVDYLNERL